MTGTVELKRARSNTWVAAAVGAQIESATVVSTGFRSTALLAIGNSTIVVRPLTRLTLDELMTQNNNETVNVNLNTGRIRVDVNPPAGGRSNFSVQSPSSTASVRGTAFEMDTVSIRVSEGAVSYSSGGSEPVIVSAGQESWINTSGSALTPMEAAEAACTYEEENGSRLRVVIGSGAFETVIKLFPDPKN
jgi:ferric-dicitrate binding protein FerR (iron transport regulator)